MPKSVAMTASLSGCACTNAKLGYSTLSYAFEWEDTPATLSLFAKRVNRELHNEPDQLPATRMTNDKGAFTAQVLRYHPSFAWG
jgi:hypothetical protein